MKHSFFDNFKINPKKEGFTDGSEFASDMIKSRMDVLKMHKELIKVQTTQELKTLTANLRSLMENEKMPPELVNNIMTSLNEETIKALEKI